MNIDKLCEKIIYLIIQNKTSSQICKELNISREEFLMGLRAISESGTHINVDKNGEVLSFGFPKRQKTTYDMPLNKEHIRLALLGDTHLGSKYDDVDSLRRAYDVFEDKKVDVVFHSGDVTDGIVSNGDYFKELKETTYDGQLRYAIDRYPKYSGKTFAVSGNHDDYWHMITGREIIKDISEERDDIVYLGSSRRFININGLKINVLHGKFSRKNPINNIYEYVNNLPEDRKPNIIHSGHYHNGEYVLYDGVKMFRNGAYMKTSPHDIAQGLTSDNATYMVDVYFDDNGNVAEVKHMKHTFRRR